VRRLAVIRERNECTSCSLSLSLNLSIKERKNGEEEKYTGFSTDEKGRGKGYLADCL
jgi:hypothetical protein